MTAKYLLSSVNLSLAFPKKEGWPWDTRGLRFWCTLTLVWNNDSVSPLSCVSCVPASCVHICFVSCPCFMSLWVKYVPAVFVSLCVNYPVYISPVFWVWFRLVYSLLPGVSGLWVLSCPALMWLKTIIWVYILVCVFLFLPRVCTVTDRNNINPKRRRLFNDRKCLTI